MTTCSKDVLDAFDKSRHIYDGIIAPSVSDIPVSCPTPNCAWLVFSSLGVYGTCLESSFGTPCDSKEGCSYEIPSTASIFSATDASSESFCSHPVRRNLESSRRKPKCRHRQLGHYITSKITSAQNSSETPAWVMVLSLGLLCDSYEQNRK
jgi:hypothetical protein